MRCMTATLGALALALTGTSVQSAPPGSAADHLRSAAQAGSVTSRLPIGFVGRKAARGSAGGSTMPAFMATAARLAGLPRVYGYTALPAVTVSPPPAPAVVYGAAPLYNYVLSPPIIASPGPDILVEPERVSNGLNLLVARADTRGSAGKRRALGSACEWHSGSTASSAALPDLFRLQI